MRKENLQINPEDFRLMGCNKDEELLEDTLSGQWYKRTYIKMKTVESVFIVPIIIFTDKTHVDEAGNFTLDPVMFTLAIFKRHVREIKDAWRVLGIKQPDHFTSAETTKAQRLGI